ncbi:hypothetical protein Dthio_PD2164 [Desulfonatronospira thiodismutans ASO3-1]|uniref:TOTE conflict systems S1/CSD-like domain-containing protein n=1 Tax=Desulfonatronospira thiodismutans ASO3-1 TaxID=555779 RepID=D6SPW1_9BACT|nr:hypothetical protein [Desulfonatronospira thiodismutans]EFI34787.1 hypothetical protein Dthio_PD2164 [Desulfonatronospira thiodismutans ASO3-1]
MAYSSGQENINQLLERAKAASGQDDREKALSLYRQAVKAAPNLVMARTGLAWEIVKSLKEQKNNDFPNPQHFLDLLREYACIHDIKKPGRLHSQFLRWAANAAAKEKISNFISILRWWDPANFRLEDFERFRPDGGDRSFDSLVELAIRGIAKNIKKENDQYHLDWATEFVGQHYDKYPHQEWFPHYYSKLLIKTGRMAQARELLLPLVRKKQNEFWSWTHLAQTYPGDNDTRLSCLCRALLCPAKEEKYRVKVHEELAEILVEKEKLPEARYEIEQAINIQESNEWKVSAKMQLFRSSPWFSQVQVLNSNRQLYQDHSSLAEEIVFHGLPVHPAIVIKHLPEKDKRPGLTFMGFTREGSLEQVLIKTKKFPVLNNMPPGTPLSLSLELSGQEPVVINLEPREGESWDIIEPRPGVVKNINTGKGITFVALSSDEFCPVYHDSLPEIRSFEPGDGLNIRTVSEKDMKQRVVWIGKKEELPSFARRFSGSLNLKGWADFGFVDEVYIPRELVGRWELKNKDELQGVALMEYNPKKEQYGWRAVSLYRKQE